MTTAYQELIELASSRPTEARKLASMVHATARAHGGPKQEDLAQLLLERVLLRPAFFRDAICARSPSAERIVGGSAASADFDAAETCLQRYLARCLVNAGKDQGRRSRTERMTLDAYRASRDTSTIANAHDDSEQACFNSAVAEIDRIVDELESAKVGAESSPRADFDYLCNLATEGRSFRHELAQTIADPDERVKAYNRTVKRHHRLREAILAGVDARETTGAIDADVAKYCRVIIDRWLNRRPNRTSQNVDPSAGSS